MAHSESESEEVGVPLVAETGLPLMSEQDKEKNTRTSIIFLVVAPVLTRAIGLGFAYLIYWLGKAKYDMRLAALGSIGGSGKGNLELGYLYFAAGVFSLLVTYLNTIPMLWKAKVMPGNGGNLRSNMFIYKVNQVDRSKRLPYVVMEEEGELGNYNRGNRSLGHFVENVLGLVLNIVLAGLVFSEAVLVLVCIYAVARVWYQVAYSVGGYGKHGLPFMVHTILVAPIVELLVWFAGVRLLQH